MGAKQSLSAEDFVKIVDKAKRDILISLGASVFDWQQEDVVSSIKKALKRGVEIAVLCDRLIYPNRNPIYRYLRFETLYHSQVYIYELLSEPIVFFILVDGKDFILSSDLPQLGDRLNGAYLRDKFMDAVGRSKLISG